jgi:hypothetical protein
MDRFPCFEAGGEPVEARPQPKISLKVQIIDFMGAGQPAVPHGADLRLSLDVSIFGAGDHAAKAAHRPRRRKASPGRA